MRITMETLEKIVHEFPSLEVGDGYKHGELSLRFGHWRKVDVERLKQILPEHLTVKESLVDDDPECGELWCYIITQSHGV